MPFKYVCGKCGYVLEESGWIKPIDDVITKYEKRCPSCMKELEKDVSKIEIKGHGKGPGTATYTQS